MNKKIGIFLIVFLVLLIPLVFARDYGAGGYGLGKYGIGEPLPPSEEPDIGRGGGLPAYECSQDSDCGENRYCFNHKCYDAECFDNTDCAEDESCWHGRCAKLFDIEIIDFESPAELGDFFDFTYLIKGMADISDDVEVHFWIEKDGERVTSGHDTIYIASFEEKIKTSKIFLPSKIASGDYVFFVQVIYGTYTVKSHRTIEIEIEKGVAKIISIPSLKGFRVYIISILIVLAFLILFIIFYIERRKIKKGFITKEKWIKRHKFSILIFLLFIIFGTLAYFLNWLNQIIRGISKVFLWIELVILPYVKTNIIPFSIIVLILVILIIIMIIMIMIIVIKRKRKKRIRKRVSKRTRKR